MDAAAAALGDAPAALLRELPNRPTQRACKLAAELEQASNGGPGLMHNLQLLVCQNVRTLGRFAVPTTCVFLLAAEVCSFVVLLVLLVLLCRPGRAELCRAADGRGQAGSALALSGHLAGHSWHDQGAQHPPVTHTGHTLPRSCPRCPPPLVFLLT